ncbi:MAG: thioredoxin family protein [Paraglaciecola sp.]|uniref:thioredoxin family protein n=1 Tax=Paraglaciecola sp. TaxID=1920173 RepID=UPI0032999DFC
MIFDSTINFEDTLNKAFKDATEQNKKVIVEYGGDWCIWSERMYSVLEKKKFKSFISDNFIFVRCYIGREWENTFPTHIEIPDFDSVPFFSLLSSDGEFLSHQNTEPFEILWFYNKRKLFDLFKEWSCV